MRLKALAKANQCMKLIVPTGVFSPSGSDSPYELALIGILGGMGPAATIDFMQKMLVHTPARRDQEHVPVIVASVPQIPDRTEAYRGIGRSPLAALIASGQRLVQAGASAIVIPCNTAHLWFEDLERAFQIPMLHIVDAALERVRSVGTGLTNAGATKIGLLATRATIESDLYVERAARILGGNSLKWVLPTEEEMDKWITPAIALVKAGKVPRASAHLVAATNALVRRGATAVIMGCTEIPVALRDVALDVRMIDATDALAEQAVHLSKNWPGK